MADTVIAHHDYEAQQDDELSLKKGDIIQVTDSSNTDWWVGKNQDGKTGVFPSNFVEANEEPVKDNKDEASIPVDSKPIPENNQNDKEEEVTDEPAEQVTHPIGRARVMEDYAMQNDDEITLHKGSIITLYEKLDDDWFKGEINGKHGKFPSKYVEEIDIPGRPDIGAPSGGHIENSGSSSSPESKVPAGGFKLAAFGVKQGGIGSVLAGGFPTLKKTSAAQPVKQQQQPVSTSNDHHESSSSIPTRTSTVESIPSPVSTSNESTDSPVKKSQVKAIVLHPYEAENEDELNLIRGEYIEVLDQNLEEDGWWKGKNEKNQIGIFPSNFVKEIELDQHAAPPVRTSRKSVTSVGSTTKASSFNDITTNATAGTGTARPSSVPSVSRLPPLPDTRPNTIASSHILTTQQQQQQQPSIKEEDANEDQQEINDTIKEQKEKENEQEQVEEKKVHAPLESKANDEKEQNENVESLNADENTTKDNVDEQLKGDQKPEASSAVDVTPTIAPRPTEILNAEQKEEVKEEEEKEKEEKQVQKDDVKEVEVEPKSVDETPKEDEEKVVEEEPKEDEKKENIASTNNDEEKEEKEKEEVTPPAEEVQQQKEEETETIEKKNDFGILPTAGPRLTSPARASRPTQRSTPRRPPTTTTATSHEPSQTELLQQEIEKTPDVPEKKESAEESAVSPPPKPVKPIFAKFPTPFAGMGNNNENPLKNLKPVQRRMFEPVPAHESSSTQHDNNNDNNNNDNSDAISPPPKPAGVRNLASRFAGIPSSGGNDVLETKLKNFTKNEVEKLRKELALEKSQREQLEELVQSLADKIELLQQQINS